MNLSLFDKLAMSSYTSAEKQAFYQMVCGMMVIDRHADPREKKLVEEIVATIGLSDAERIASRLVSTERQLQILKSMDIIKKCYLAKMLAQVALADGVITKEENAFFAYYTKYLGLPSDPDEL